MIFGKRKNIRRIYLNSGLLLLNLILILLILRILIGNPNGYFIDHFDWNLHLSWAGSARRTLLSYGQFPLWNPFRCGGTPVIGEPESDLVSLYLPLLLFFGPVFGFVALFVISLAIGIAGFYKLARYFGISSAGSLLGAQAYMLSGLFILPFLVGMTNFLSIAYLPFIFLYFEKYLKSNELSQAIKTGFFTGLMFLSGFHYIPIIILYLGVRAAVKSATDKKSSSFLKFIVVLILFIGFSAVKLLPALDIIRNNTLTNIQGIIF